MFKLDAIDPQTSLLFSFNNFPDIFFGDSFPSSSLLNANLDDLKPFGSDFKTDLGVDLDVDKNILADLFPPSATIERNADEEDDTEANKVDKTQGHFTATSMDKVLSSVSTKEFEFQSGRKKGSSSKSSRSLKKSGSLSAAVEPTLTKVNVEPSREPARVTIFAADDSFIGMSNNIQVLPNDFQKVSKLLEPLNLESLSVLSPMDIKLEDMKSLKPLVPHKALVPSKFKEVALVKDQVSLDSYDLNDLPAYDDHTFADVSAKVGREWDQRGWTPLCHHRDWQEDVALSGEGL